MKTASFLFLAAMACSALAADAPPSTATRQALEEQYVVTYGISLAAPQMVEICKAVNPYQAPTFDFALDRWQKANGNLIKLSRERVQEIAKRENVNAEAELMAQRDRMIADLKSAEPEMAMQRCQHLLDLLSDGVR